jgi:flagellar biosynthetic protein FliP
MVTALGVCALLTGVHAFAADRTGLHVAVAHDRFLQVGSVAAGAGQAIPQAASNIATAATAPASGATAPANSVPSPATPPTTPPVARAPQRATPAPQTLQTPATPLLSVIGLGGSSASWTIVVLMTLLALIPSLLLCVTPFARLLIVFHFLRQALGLQTTPSNQTLIGLSMILTFFLMQPVGKVMYETSVVPLEAGTITPLEALARAGDPMRTFMTHYVRDKDVEMFLEIAKEPRPQSIKDISFRVLLPAYILSELKAGFQIGTVLFLPFLVVDMVVASITTSVGMMQLPPVVISTPLKLLLFLMVDGWHLLIGSLMRSFS